MNIYMKSCASPQHVSADQCCKSYSEFHYLPTRMCPNIHLMAADSCCELIGVRRSHEWV